MSAHSVAAIKDLQPRLRQSVEGKVVAITYPEAHQLPQLTVYVHDGTGTAVAVWMGRSELPGVRVGDRIHLEATVSVRSGQPVLLNPYYRLLESK